MPQDVGQSEKAYRAWVCSIYKLKFQRNVALSGRQPKNQFFAAVTALLDTTHRLNTLTEDGLKFSVIRWLLDCNKSLNGKVGLGCRNSIVAGYQRLHKSQPPATQLRDQDMEDYLLNTADGEWDAGDGIHHHTPPITSHYSHSVAGNHWLQAVAAIYSLCVVVVICNQGLPNAPYVHLYGDTYTTSHSSRRRRLHGVKEMLLFVTAVPSAFRPLIHQQLSVTTTLSAPETLAVFNGSWQTLL